MLYVVVFFATSSYNYSVNKTINIKSKKALKQVEQFKKKNYTPVDIRLQNVNLKTLNKIIMFDLFDKNDLFINSTTLWELMQPIGDSGSHNYHGLLPEDILDALNSLETPNYILKVKQDRYAIIPVTISSYNEPLMVIVEIGGALIKNKNANINRVVTIYPKSDIEDMVNKMKTEDILFNKKMSINSGSNCRH